MRAAERGEESPRGIDAVVDNMAESPEDLLLRGAVRFRDGPSPMTAGVPGSPREA